MDPTEALANASEEKSDRIPSPEAAAWLSDPARPITGPKAANGHSLEDEDEWSEPDWDQIVKEAESQEPDRQPEDTEDNADRPLDT